MNDLPDAPSMMSLTNSNDFIFVVMTSLTFTASGLAGLAFRNLTAHALTFYFGASSVWCLIALAAGAWTPEDATRCAVFMSFAAVVVALEVALKVARGLPRRRRRRTRWTIFAAVLGLGALGLTCAAWPVALHRACRGRLPLEAVVVVALAVVLAAARRPRFGLGIDAVVAHGEDTVVDGRRVYRIDAIESVRSVDLVSARAVSDAELAGLRALLIPDAIGLLALAMWEPAPMVALWLSYAGGLAYVILALAAARTAWRVTPRGPAP